MLLRVVQGLDTTLVADMRRLFLGHFCINENWLKPKTKQSKACPNFDFYIHIKLKSEHF